MVIAGITLSSMHQSSLGFPVRHSNPPPAPVVVLDDATGVLPRLFVVGRYSTIIIGSYVSIWMFKQTLSEKVLEKLGSFMPWFIGLYLLLKLVDFVWNAKWNLLSPPAASWAFSI